MSKKLTQEEFIKKAKKIHGNKYDYSLTVYTKNRNSIEIFCNTCKKVFKQIAANHLNGAGCPECIKKMRRLSREIFIQRAILIHNNKYDYSQVNYINSTTKVKIYCKQCKKYFLQTPKGHLKGHGCKKCGIVFNAKNRTMTFDEFIKRAKKVHGDIYDYSYALYKNITTKIKIYCKQCNHFFMQSPAVHLTGRGCSHCRRSIGEAIIQRFFDERNIAYKKEKYFNGCKDKAKLLFDFYLPTYNTCIEYQGMQHYNTNFLRVRFKYSEEKAKEALILQQKHDQIKRDYCKQNGINLLEITYKDNVKKVLEEWYEKNMQRLW